MAPTLGGAALWYGAQGHLVFPLRATTKVPATAHGFKDSSMDADTIRAWWTENPAYNIGLTTGHLFDVIDVDGPEGIRNVADMAPKIPPIIGIVATPRGYHLYIKPTGDRCATAIVPGIDYRGIGGYVVAPPSTVNGVTYRWLDPLS